MAKNNDSRERFNARDVVQISVGSFIGSLGFALTNDTWQISDGLRWFNLALVALLSVFSAFFIAYYIGVRMLGHKRRRMILHFIPLRTLSHYAIALLISAALLFLLQVCTFATPAGIVLRRVVLLALPATVLGSAVDLVDSQKCS